MKIGFLTIGTEILLGDTVNTNLTNLGKRLYDAGFKLDKEITIADNEEEITDAMSFLLDRCDVIVTSGGLGPTEGRRGLQVEVAGQLEGLSRGGCGRAGRRRLGHRGGGERNPAATSAEGRPR